MENLSSLIVLFSLLLLIFIGSFIVVKRHWINKKWINAGSQFVGRNIYMQFQNVDKKQAIEHIQYQEDDEKDQAFSGDNSKLKNCKD